MSDFNAIKIEEEANDAITHKLGSFVFSATIHLIVVILLLELFSSKDSKFSAISKIQPVAVISGSQFSAIKAKFFKNKKKTVNRILDKTAQAPMAKNNIQERQKGSRESKLKNGLTINATSTGQKNYNNSYLNIIANKLEQNKSYIAMSSAPDAKARVMLRVILDVNGRLSSYKVVENSRYSFFNKAAVKILELSSPFPKPPSDLGPSPEFIVPILFDAA
jgi:TonB family protein